MLNCHLISLPSRLVSLPVELSPSSYPPCSRLSFLKKASQAHNSLPVFLVGMLLCLQSKSKCLIRLPIGRGTYLIIITAISITQ